jgi:hypothetical protein
MKALRMIATGLAAVCLASATLPALAAYAPILIPFGTFIVGAFHVHTRKAAP